VRRESEKGKYIKKKGGRGDPSQSVVLTLEGLKEKKSMKTQKKESGKT